MKPVTFAKQEAVEATVVAVGATLDYTRELRNVEGATVE